MTDKRAPTRVRRPERGRVTLPALHQELAPLLAHLTDMRVQQAQTEKHLADLTNAVLRAAEHGKAVQTFIDGQNRLEALVRQLNEGFSVVQHDIGTMQKFVGRQTELLAQLGRPMTAEELTQRVAEARRMSVTPVGRIAAPGIPQE